jgi:predicted  nucleic acid-binding Zn-ribbon protein
MAASDDRLAAAMYTFTSLRRENESLRNEVRLVRGQNARLSDQVQKLAQQKYALERELAAVNGPLYAEKKAHDEALRVFASKPNEGGRIAFKAGLFARPE